jgi:hypothetical protein
MSFLCLSSCAPKPFTPFIPPKVEFTPTAPYVFDITKELSKPDAPKQILLDENFKPTVDKDKAKFIGYDVTEHNKIVALVKLFNAQREIINEHTVLINVHIATINQLKELVELKDAAMREYISLWTNAENAYREEKHQHNMDNLVNKSLMYIITVGSIILLAVGL